MVSPSPVGVGSGEGVELPQQIFFGILPLGMIHFGALFICLKVRSQSGSKVSWTPRPLPDI